MITKMQWEYKSKYEYYLVDTIPSTNTYLKENSDLYPDKTVLIALKQTKGRGRYDRVWKSNNDIIFSLLLKNNGSYEIIAPLAVCLGLMEFGFETGIKWPNDIYMNDKKLAGILIEDVFTDKFVSSVIGIGINMEEKESFHSAGLNTNISKYEIIHTIIEKFDELTKLDIHTLICLYKTKSIIIGKQVYYHDKLYTASDIDDLGHLILKNDNDTLSVSCDEINIKEALVK